MVRTKLPAARSSESHRLCLENYPKYALSMPRELKKNYVPCGG
jgi:hypothetical protein